MKPLRSPHLQRFQQQRYAARSFRNPYFQPKQRPRWLRPLLAFVILTTTGVGAWCALTLPVFAIHTVRISGNETIPTDVLTEAVQQYLGRRRLFVFHPSNRFLFDAEVLAQNLNGTFSFERVRTERRGDQLEVTVHEKQSLLLWKSAGRALLVDETGNAIRALTAEETVGLAQPDPPALQNGTLAPLARLKRLRVFTDVNNAEVKPGAAVLAPKEITGAARFTQRLLDAGIPFVETRVDRLAGTWMAVRTLRGYDILFDPLADADLQATRLQTLLRDTLKETKGLSYIDLRFGDHVYYK